MSAILHKKTFQELTTDELYELLRVRSEVFVVEQNCVYQDLDYDDQKSIHLWLTEGETVVALARVCLPVLTCRRFPSVELSLQSEEKATANKSCYMP